jgi:hypothetical protein
MGIAFSALWGWRARIGRATAVCVGSGVLVAYALTLQAQVMEWNASGARSHQMALDLWRAGETSPEGSLVVFNAPATNIIFPVWHGSAAFAFPADGPEPQVGTNPAGPTLVWAWAAPFLYGPPFVPPQLDMRITFVEPPGVYCCPADQWLRRTQATIATWRSRPERPPLLILQWDDVRGAEKLHVGSVRAQQTLDRVLTTNDPVEASTLLQEMFQSEHE